MQMENEAKKKQQIPAILSKLLPFILGICVLGAGIAGMVQERQRTKNYETITAYCSAHNYSYTEDDGTVYYRWNYSYHVDGQEYSVTTGFNANFSPVIGSPRTIRYNPIRPGEAVIPDMNVYSIIIFAGIIITAFALIGILNTFLRYFPVDLSGIVKGIAFMLLGAGINYLLSGTFSIMSTYTAFPYMLVIIFPVVFIVVGICITVRSLFRKMGSKETVEEGWNDMTQ